MLLDEWNLDEAKEVWFEEGWELAEAKYQPVIAEKDLMLTAKDQENQKLKRILREAGIEPPQD
jgi:transcriptional regulator of met regulon